MRVLVVDDAVFIRKVLRGIFQEIGVEVVGEASTGIEAERLIDQLNPDIVTLDITLPDENGIDLLRKLKVTKPDIAVIMVSALSNSDMQREAVREGAVGYITKPFSKNRIEELIKNIEVKRLKKRETLELQKQEKVEENIAIQELEDEENKLGLSDTIQYGTEEKEDQSFAEQEKLTNVMETEKKAIENYVQSSDFQIKTELHEATEQNVLEAEEFDQKEVSRDESKSLVLDIALEKKKNEEVVVISFSTNEFEYNIGRARIGSGVVLNIDNCYISSNVRRLYEFDGSIVNTIKVQEVNGGCIIVISTNTRKYSVREIDDKLYIIFIKSKATISYSRQNKLLMLDNIPKDSFEIHQINEKEYQIRISSKEIFMEDETFSVDDEIISSVRITKAVDSYLVNILLSKEATYEIIEGKTVTGIRFNEVKVLKDIKVEHNELETKVYLVTSTENYQVEVEKTEDSNVTHICLRGFVISPQLLNREFEFEEGYIDKIRILEDRQQVAVCISVYTPVKKVFVTKERGYSCVVVKPTKVFLLYNNFSDTFIFQNVTLDEFEYEYNRIENVVEVRIKNRYITLIEDPLLKNERYEIFSNIEAKKVDNIFEVKIWLTTQCKVSASNSKSGNAVDLLVVPIRKLNKIKSYEYEPKGKVNIFTVIYDGELEYKIVDEKDDVVSVIFLNMSLEKSDAFPVEFTEGNILKVEASEVDEGVMLNIYTIIKEFSVEKKDDRLIFIFELQEVQLNTFVDEERFIIELSGIEVLNCNVVEEDEIVIIEIDRRDIYIEKGFVNVKENQLVKRIQVVYDNRYKIILYLLKTDIFLNTKCENNSTLIVLEKIPELINIALNEGENTGTLVLEFDREIKDLVKVESGCTKTIIYLERLNTNQQFDFEKYKGAVVKSVKYEADGNVKFVINHVFSAANTCIEMNIVRIEFTKVTTRVEVNNDFIAIKNVNTIEISIDYYEKNGTAVIFVPFTAGYIDDSSVKVFNVPVKYYVFEDSIYQQWVVLLIGLEKAFVISKEENCIYLNSMEFGGKNINLA